MTMTSKPYFAYIRVFPNRPGLLRKSLVKQRSAIERHAQEKNLCIIREFQEQATAVKCGRPIFKTMIKALKAGKACGVIMHTIDRGARNLRDWAELVELIDGGVEVHVADENLHLTSGGRLDADVQTHLTTNYIRNLRKKS